MVGSGGFVGLWACGLVIIYDDCDHHLSLPPFSLLPLYQSMIPVYDTSLPSFSSGRESRSETDSHSDWSEMTIVINHVNDQSSLVSQ